MSTPGSRTERRKAETRQKLVRAARSMLAAGTAQRASIEEITEAADVGFGTFYNHFTGKDELFAAAVDSVLTEVGALLEHLHGAIDDPVAAFTLSVRLSILGSLRRPELAEVLVRHGLSYLDSPQGPAAFILRDIEAAVATGRLHAANPKLALSVTLGSVLATLRLALADASFAADPIDQQLAEHLLLGFGLPPEEARALATIPLPEL